MIRDFCIATDTLDRRKSPRNATEPTHFRAEKPSGPVDPVSRVKHFFMLVEVRFPTKLVGFCTALNEQVPRVAAA